MTSPPPPSQNDKTLAFNHSPKSSISSITSILHYTLPELTTILAEVIALKIKGNVEFKKMNWELANEWYKIGLSSLPGVGSIEAGLEKRVDRGEENEVETISLAQKERDEEEDKWKEVRDLYVTLQSNSAATSLKLENYDQALTSSTAALLLSPTHLKARKRKATAQEKLGNYLDALEEWKMLEADQLGDEGKVAVERLERLSREKGEKEKEEVIRKLKDLGNSVLGKFGLSLDNFVSKPTGEGGYTMNFEP